MGQENSNVNTQASKITCFMKANTADLIMEEKSHSQALRILAGLKMYKESHTCETYCISNEIFTPPHVRCAYKLIIKSSGKPSHYGYTHTVCSQICCHILILTLSVSGCAVCVQH